MTEWIEGLLRDAPAPARLFGELDGRLQVVGCDLAHSRLVVFPDDIALYEDEQGHPMRPDAFPIADGGPGQRRISVLLPATGPSRPARRRRRQFSSTVASPAPFRSSSSIAPAPRRPTWGFRLHAGMGVEKPSHREIGGLDWPVEMARAILDTAMNAFDARDVLGFGDRVISIPTGDVETLDFNLSAEERDFLYESGHEAGTAFFEGNPSGRNALGEVPRRPPF